MQSRILIILLVLLLIGCAKKEAIDIKVETSIPQQETNEKGQTLCKDHFCFFEHFKNCKPAIMSIPINNSEYNYDISVEGVVENKCHYTKKIGEKGVDCMYPLEKMDAEAFEHLFGTDKMLGKTEVVKQQTELTKQYCKEI